MIPTAALLSFIFLVITVGGYGYSIYWAYHDAERRGQSGALVALLVFLLFWPLGLILWIALRPERRRG